LCTETPRALLGDERPGSCVRKCGEHHGDAGRRRIGAGCRGRRCRGRSCGSVEGIPGRVPERTGCDAAGRGMVTGIGRSALWRGMCPCGARGARRCTRTLRRARERAWCWRSGRIRRG
jgi:hypothetical protein